MKRLIFMIMVGSIVLTGCGVRNKDNDDIIDNKESIEAGQDNIEMKNQINDIESVLNDLGQLETNLDDIADEDLVSE